MMKPVNIRLLNQQLLFPQFYQPEEVVAHFGAMQAQEYRMMRWAVCMRTLRPSLKAFTKAFNKGKIVRLHLLRGTWQLVSAEDYWWMLDLCAPRARLVIRGWMSGGGNYIPDSEIHDIRKILVDVTRKKGSVEKTDFEVALAAKGISMDHHRLTYHIRFAELDGVLCSGRLQPMKTTYALSEKKIPRTEPIERDWALAKLATKYFQSHSPATLEDFVWWSGLTAADCRRAIEILGNHLRCKPYMDKTFYLHEDCRTRGFRGGKYILLPPYDEYLIGYKSRDIVLDPAFKHFAHNNSGIFQPVVAYDGSICGNWSPFKEDMNIDFFAADHGNEDLSDAINRYRRFLNH